MHTLPDTRERVILCDCDDPAVRLSCSFRTERLKSVGRTHCLEQRFQQLELGGIPLGTSVVEQRRLP